MFEDMSGLPNSFNRAALWPDAGRMVVPEGVFFQGANANEMQSIIERRGQRVANLVAKDGDRTSGAGIVINAGTAKLAAGTIYIAGDVRPVAAATLTKVPMTGDVAIGVRLQRVTVTHVEDPRMLGLMPGSLAEGEPGAARIDEQLVWAMQGDAQKGDFYQVYVIRDGVVIDQAPPPVLSGIMGQIATYDRDANGSYIVSGNEVSALGRQNGNQVFVIAAGTANIEGFKRIHETAMRFVVPEEPDLETITAEPHTFNGVNGAATIIPVDRAPIAAIQSVVGVRRVTDSLTRGPQTNGTDGLTYSSIVAIEKVVQGATVFREGQDYIKTSGGISWSTKDEKAPEPAAGSSYSVTYLYHAPVTPKAWDETSITVDDLVQNQPVLISYTSKLPRIDMIGLDIHNRPTYVKGISARTGAMPPLPPANLLKLAEISNTWMGVPAVNNNGTRNLTYDAQRRLERLLINVVEQFCRNAPKQSVIAGEPVALDRIFTDLFTDDFYRDQGAPQTAAINRGVLQLAVDNMMEHRVGTAIETLPYTNEVLVSQLKATSAMRINSYDNFTPFPAGMRLSPAVDFWTEQQTQWTSPVTREFTAAPGTPPGESSLTELAEITRVSAPLMRQIPVTARLEGFGAGENLSTLTFAGINVKPAGVQTADQNGLLTVTFNIPQGVPSGKAMARATGAAGSFAEAMFAAEGTIDVNTMRRVTLVSRAGAPPVQVTNITVVNQISQTVVNQNVVDQNVREREAGGGIDPLAQSFMLPDPRMISAVRIRLAKIGSRANGLRVQLVKSAGKMPSNEILAEAFVSMQTVQEGVMTEVPLPCPIPLSVAEYYWVKVLTADGAHELAICKIGDVDPVTQTRVTSQAYTIGDLAASSNNYSYLLHPDRDLCFEILAAKFTATRRVVDLWTGDIVQISDVLVRGTVDIPSSEARFRYELVRQNGAVIPLAPGQTREFPEYLSEKVTIRAVLEGTEKVSPILYPGTQIIFGRIRQSGTYVTKAFDIGQAMTVKALFKAFLPAGSSVSVEVDGANNTWQALAPGPARQLPKGWSEPGFQLGNVSAAQGRLRITLNGGAGARCSIAQLRAYPR